jgi:hypothetical protein
MLAAFEYAGARDQEEGGIVADRVTGDGDG